MGMNRRNALIGMGTIAAGGGALFATGAFSQVEASRTVSVSTSGDSGALLSFSDGGSTFISTDGNDLIQIDQSNLNRNAVTRAEGAIDVSHSGSNSVGFYVQDDTDVGSILDFEHNGGSIVGSANAIDLPDDGTAISIDLVFNLEGETDNTNIPTEVTFVADTDSYSGA